MNIKLTTLCYLKHDGKYLMIKKANDGGQSAGKYLGVGGKLEEGESPDECAKREIMEETGLEALDLKLRGIITFISDVWDDEIMFLYSAEQLKGEFRDDCDEGELFWIDEDKVLDLPAWEGDRYFLKPLLDGEDDIQLKLIYSGDRLMEVYRDGAMLLCRFV